MSTPSEKSLSNLRPCRAGEERTRELASKGGKARVAQRRQARELREGLKILMDKPMRRGKVSSLDDAKALSDLEGKNLTCGDLFLLKVMDGVLNGNVKMMDLACKIMGQYDQPPAHEETAPIEDALKELREIVADRVAEGEDGTE